MHGPIQAVARIIYEIVNYNKKHTDKDRKGFHSFLSEKYNIIVSMSSVNRWLSDIETDYHLPLFALIPFIEYFKDTIKIGQDAPSGLGPLIYLAHEAGYRLQQIEPSKSVYLEIIHKNSACEESKNPLQSFFIAVAKDQKESADVITAAAEAMEDGELDKQELRKIHDELLEQLESVSVLMDIVGKGLR